MPNQSVTLTPSPLESQRFGLHMVRAQLASIDPEALRAAIVAGQADVVIARAPAELQHELYKPDSTGFHWLVADTLVYYVADLGKYTPRELRNRDLQFVPATPAHHALLDSMVATIFAGYRNHYSSNPRLAADLLPGYQEWVRTYSTGSDPSKRAWVVQRGDTPIAFATCAAHGSDSAKREVYGEGVLYGVLPAAAGGGVYSDIIRFTQRFYQEAGFATFKVSTQVQNYAVQKVWNREGFVLSEAFLTLHINAMLRAGKTAGPNAETHS